MSIVDIVNSYKGIEGCYRCGEKDTNILEYYTLKNTKRAPHIYTMIAEEVELRVIMHEVSKCIVMCNRCFEKYYGKYEIDSSGPQLCYIF